MSINFKDDLANQARQRRTDIITERALRIELKRRGRLPRIITTRRPTLPKFDFTENKDMKSRKYTANNLDIGWTDRKAIEDVISPRLRHATIGGMSRRSDVNIRLYFRNDTYKDAKTNKPFYHNKTFPSFRLKDIDDFLTSLQQYSQNPINGSDVDMTIVKLEITIINENAGGCSDARRGETERVSKDTKIKKPRASNNNCLFACFTKELNLGTRLGRVKCNDIRRRYNIKPDEQIPISTAIEILKQYRKEDTMEFEIVDNETFETFATGDNPQYTARLHEGHYERTYYIPKITCGQCGRVYTNEKKIHECKSDRINFYNRQILRNNHRSLITKFNPDGYNNKEELIHYDLETFQNPNITKGFKIHETYIAGFSCDSKYQEKEGKTSIKDFVDFLLDLSNTRDKEKPIYVNAFNGSNFDHYEIYKEFLRRGIKPDSYMINNGSVISFQYKQIKLWDMAKHLLGTLKQNLIDLKCDVLKGDFDHEIANRSQGWERMSEEDKMKCRTYLQKDVLGLKELYDKMNTAVFNKYNANLTSYISTSSLAFNIWKKFIGNTYDIRLPTLEQEKIFRSAVMGGRCYKTKNRFLSSQYDDYKAGRITFEEVTDYLVDLDANSLYPAAMMNEYPVGEWIAQNEPVKEMKSKGGCWYVKYKTNKHIPHSPIPRRDDKGCLKWDLEDGEGWYFHPDVENMLKCGYEVEILKGVYTEKTAKVFAGYINEMYNEKKNSEKGSCQYILAKLFMNGLYGKMIQRPIQTECRLIRYNNEYWKFWGTHIINDIVRIDIEGKPTMWQVSGTPRNLTIQEKNITKPSHYGGLILAYRRSIMLNYIMEANPYFNDPKASTDKIVNNDIYYTDTDAITVHAKSAMRIKNKHKDKLGYLSDDLGDSCKIIRAIWIAPKLYALEFTTPEAHIKGMTKADDKHIAKGVHINVDEKTGFKSYYHFRGKGLNKDKLKLSDFEKMDAGGSIENTRDFQMKKVHFSRNSKQQAVPMLSIAHLEHITKKVNENKWAGREFINDNDSVPFGFN